MRRHFPRVDMYCTGQNIKSIMKEQGLSVKDIQEYMELATPQSIYHWFTGKSLPSLDNLYALSNLFRMPIDHLLCGNRMVSFGFSRPVYTRLRIYQEKYAEFYLQSSCQG